jgi:phage anti-repressor protein
MMFEIVVIEKNKQQWVSARTLAKELGIDMKNFSRWCTDNILDNLFSYEKDFVRYGEKTKGRPKKDYLLTIETAKHISLMSRTEKGKQIREYFITIHDAYISGHIKQLELESADRINYLESAVDQRDKYINGIINAANQFMPKDPIGTESKKTGRPRINLRRACYVSAKKDDPKQLVFGFNINN